MAEEQHRQHSRERHARKRQRIRLLYAVAPVIIIAIIVGCIAFSSGTLKRVGNEIIPLRYMNAAGSQLISAAAVEIATIFGVPFSNTDAFISSVYGAGVGYRRRLLQKKPFLTIVSLRFITALIGFCVGFLIMKAALIV